MVAPLETELYDDVGRGLPALLSSVRAFEVALELAEAEALVLLEAEALGDAVSEADALALDELAAEDEDATLLTEEEQALSASTATRAAESGIARRRGLYIEVSFNSDYCTVFIAPTYSFYLYLSIKCRIYPSYFRKAASYFMFIEVKGGKPRAHRFAFSR